LKEREKWKRPWKNLWLKKRGCHPGEEKRFAEGDCRKKKRTSTQGEIPENACAAGGVKVRGKEGIQGTHLQLEISRKNFATGEKRRLPNRLSLKEVVRMFRPERPFSIGGALRRLGDEEKNSKARN